LRLPSHWFSILAKVIDERQHKVPPDGIIGPFRYKAVVDIAIEPDVLVQNIPGFKPQAGHIILEQFPV
jgi:hypothetical protein